MGQGHTKCCLVHLTSCDLCTSKVWYCYNPRLRRRCIYKKIYIWPWHLGQGHTKCCPVPPTSCDLCTYRVWSYYVKRFRRCIHKKICSYPSAKTLVLGVVRLRNKRIFLSGGMQGSVVHSDIVFEKVLNALSEVQGSMLSWPLNQDWLGLPFQIPIWHTLCFSISRCAILDLRVRWYLSFNDRYRHATNSIVSTGMN